VVKAAGVRLLLAVGHAVVTAHYLQYGDPMKYIRDMPLELVLEIQLSHAGLLDGIVEDLHEVPTERDLWIVEEVLAAGAPVAYVTVEYYRDPDILCSVYQSLDRHFSGTDSSA